MDDMLGRAVGADVGDVLGRKDGVIVGSLDGRSVGLKVGEKLGMCDGTALGDIVDDWGFAAFVESEETSCFWLSGCNSRP